MNRKLPLILGFGLALVLGLMAVAGEARAQNPSGLAPTAWFDWSDFRSDVGIRLFLARLSSGTVKKGEEGGQAFSLMRDHGLRDDPEPFREVYATLYVDRLGLRYHLDDERIFQGRSREDDAMSLSVLDISTTRLGVDLDLIRYPFIRAGINFDYYNTPVQFVDRRDITRWHTYRADEPLTVGIHGKAIPFRVREVPFTIQGRFRYPLPGIGRKDHSGIMAVELCAGLRPNVWDTSLLGHSTFGATFELGYRWEKLEMKCYGPGFSLDATWHGAMCQFSLVF